MTRKLGINITITIDEIDSFIFNMDCSIVDFELKKRFISQELTSFRDKIRKVAQENWECTIKEGNNDKI